MSKRNDAKLETIIRAEDTLEKNALVFATYKPIKDKHKLLTDQIPVLENMRGNKKVKTKGTTDEKEEAYVKLVNKAVSIAKIAIIWAKDNEKIDLMPTLDLDPSDFDGPKLDAIDLAVNLDKALRPELAKLVDYEITVDDLDDLLDKIKVLRKLNPLPQQHKIQGGEKTKAYAAGVKATFGILKDIESLIVGKYLEKNSTFVNSYLASLRIFDPATRSTVLQIMVRDADGNPIDGAYCNITQVADEEQYSNLEGKADIAGLRSGMFTLEVTKDGYKIASLNFTIKRGQKLKLVVKLEKA